MCLELQQLMHNMGSIWEQGKRTQFVLSDELLKKTLHKYIVHIYSAYKARGKVAILMASEMAQILVGRVYMVCTFPGGNFQAMPMHAFPIARAEKWEKNARKVIPQEPSW